MADGLKCRYCTPKFDFVNNMVRHHPDCPDHLDNISREAVAIPADLADYPHDMRAGSPFKAKTVFKDNFHPTEEGASKVISHLAGVTPIRKPIAATNVSASLRKLADDIDAGLPDFQVITTCVVLLGHTYSESNPDKNGNMEQRVDFSTRGFGSRCDTFTVRGLMASCLSRWGA